MTSAQQSPGEEPSAETVEGGRARVQVLVSEAGDRRALAELLGDSYEVIIDEQVQPSDCYLVGDRTLFACREALQARKDQTAEFCPVLVIEREPGRIPFDARAGRDVSALVDEVVTAPVDRATLSRRLDNLLVRREQSVALARRYERLETRFQQVFEATNDALLVVDPAADAVLESNPAARDLLGGTREDVLALAPSTVFQATGDESFAAFLREVCATGDGWTDELACTTADGRQAALSVSATTVAYEDRDAVLLSARDVTERKRREQELIEQNERLEAFASVVSHDLRNPLNVAIGRLQLAQEEGDSDHLDRAAEALDRSLELVEDLLALARQGISATDPEAVALDALAGRCWETVETSDATLSIETEQVVRADRSRLRQLLENLFRNAVEHGGPGVHIVVGDLDTGFYVADDGSGIPADEREQVFETGYSTTSAGTGFGLGIVARVAEAHGWTVNVTESTDGGARFEVKGVERAAV